MWPFKKKEVQFKIVETEVKKLTFSKDDYLLFTLPRQLSAEAHIRLKKDLESIYKGLPKGRVILLEDGLRLQAVLNKVEEAK